MLRFALVIFALLISPASAIEVAPNPYSPPTCPYRNATYVHSYTGAVFTVRQAESRHVYSRVRGPFIVTILIGDVSGLPTMLIGEMPRNPVGLGLFAGYDGENRDRFNYLIAEELNDRPARSFFYVSAPSRLLVNGGWDLRCVNRTGPTS
jgi:hypothetical protein